MKKDFDQLSEEERAELAIFTPVKKRAEDLEGHPDVIPQRGKPGAPYEGKPAGGQAKKPENVFYVIPSQKILTFLLEDLRNLLSKDDKTDNDQEPPQHKDKAPQSDSLKSSIDYLNDLLRFMEAMEPKPGDEDKADTKKKLKRPAHGKEITFVGRFGNDRDKEIKFRIIRINDCLNDETEYGGPSINILVEWDEVYDSPPGDIELPVTIKAQADNHLIVNHEASSKPRYPPQAEGEVISVYNSDFKQFTFRGTIDQNDSQYYSDFLDDQDKPNPIVAVVDTGLAYKWYSKSLRRRGRYFIHFDRISWEKSFLITKAKSSQCLPEKNFGFCGVTDYLLKPNRFDKLQALRNLTTAQIMASPYDDNLVDVKLADGIVVKEAGRHGTLVSAIINYPYLDKSRPACQVLPVKVFNCGGTGTLFDLLSGCNYIIASKRAGVDIKVINASFSGSLNLQGRDLLYKKMWTITNECNIWVVAAAGNQGWNLNEHPVYPASFGLPAEKDSTGLDKKGAGLGLDKVITVTSAHNDGDIVGNHGNAVSVKAQSAFPDGFLSVLLMEGGARLRGTSFAVPYVAAVLAKGLDQATEQNPITTRAQAIAHLQANPILRVVKFKRPS